MPCHVCVCLQDFLQLLGERPDVSWGIYLRIHSQQLLEVSLKLLKSFYSGEELFRPVWISMEALHSTDDAKVPTQLPASLICFHQHGPLITEILISFSRSGLIDKESGRRFCGTFITL